MLWGNKETKATIKMFNSKVDHPEVDSLWYSSRSLILAGLACREEKKVQYSALAGRTVDSGWMLEWKQMGAQTTPNVVIRSTVAFPNVKVGD